MQPVDDKTNISNNDSWYNLNPGVTASNYPVGSYVTPNEMDYARRYKEAAKRVEKKVNFYKSLGSFVIVCSFLWVLALLTGGSLWPLWIMFFWGIGLAFQAVDAFGGWVSDEQRRKMIDEEIRRINYK